MWKFVEIIKGKEPFTVRKLAGFPIKYGWKEVPDNKIGVSDLADHPDKYCEIVSVKGSDKA